MRRAGWRCFWRPPPAGRAAMISVGRGGVAAAAEPAPCWWSPSIRRLTASASRCAGRLATSPRSSTTWACRRPSGWPRWPWTSPTITRRPASCWPTCRNWSRRSRGCATSVCWPLRSFAPVFPTVPTGIRPSAGPHRCSACGVAGWWSASVSVSRASPPTRGCSPSTGATRPSPCSATTTSPSRPRRNGSRGRRRCLGGWPRPTATALTGWSSPGPQRSASTRRGPTPAWAARGGPRRSWS